MTAGSTSGARPVVVGVDGSEGALEAVRWAAVEAGRRGAPLRVVTAFSRAPERRPGRVEHYREELLERTRRRVLAGAVAVAERTEPGLPVSAELLVGFPIGTLLQESQLVVLGSRGLGGLSGLLVGSVAVGLAARAACPVVAVRGGDRDPRSPEPVVVGVDRSADGDAALAFAFDAAASRGARPGRALGHRAAGGRGLARARGPHRSGAGLGQPRPAAPQPLPRRRRPPGHRGPCLTDPRRNRP
jgi:nucleotide-binding universal stress UspA family protein